MTKKYILGFIGSPRVAGNTDFLVTEILNAAQLNGAKIEKIYLNKLKILPCQGCDHCKIYRSCRQKDDMQGLYKKIYKADGIVLGPPTYFGQETAQTKTFIDRTYALIDKDLNSRITKRKKGALAFIWAETNRSYAEHRKPVIEFLMSVLQDSLKAKVVEKIISGGISDSGDASCNEEFIRKAKLKGAPMLNVYSTQNRTVLKSKQMRLNWAIKQEKQNWIKKCSIVSRRSYDKKEFFYCCDRSML